jgi:hypothetical protein
MLVLISASVREQECGLCAVSRCVIEQRLDQQTRETAPAVGPAGEHRANAAGAHRPTVTHARQVIPLGAREDGGAVDQRKQSLAAAGPGRFHQRRVQPGFGRPGQTGFRRFAGPVGERAEQGTISGNDRQRAAITVQALSGDAQTHGARRQS